MFSIITFKLHIGKPSRGPTHPDFVPSVFSFNTKLLSTEVPSGRYLRAVQRNNRLMLSRPGPMENGDDIMDETGNGIDTVDAEPGNGNETETRSDNKAVDETGNGNDTMDETVYDNETGNCDDNETGNDNETAGNDNDDNETMDETGDGSKTIDETTGEMVWDEIENDNEVDDIKNGNENVDIYEPAAENGIYNGNVSDFETEDVTLNCQCEPVDDENQDKMLSSSETSNDTSVVDDEVGALIHQLEMNEVEIGELQIECQQLLFCNHTLEQENLELRSQLSQSLPVIMMQPVPVFIPNQKVQPDPHQLVTETKFNRFSATLLKDNNNLVCFYTGLPTYDLFIGLCDLLRPLVPTQNAKHQRLEVHDEILMVLMKLRLDLPNEDLAFRFQIASSTVGNIFQKWILLMSTELKCLIRWPDAIVLRENLPLCFRKHYARVRCIIDCFEIFIERPAAFEARAATYSNYKKHNTVKVLIGIAPTGCICFISQAWGGRISDKEITQRCGFLEKIEYGDVVMADRGFNIGDELAINGAYLVIPAFTRGKSQLSQREVEQTRQIARVRIHVERVIGQLRKKFKILSNTLPISLLKCPLDANRVNCTIDRILIVTAALTNLSNSVVPLS